MKYDEYCCQINERFRKIRGRAQLYFYYAKLFRERDPLAKEIFAELRKGLLGPASKAGLEFYSHYRNAVSCGGTINEFLRKKQDEYVTLECVANKSSLDNKPQSINSSCANCPYDPRKSSLPQSLDSKLEVEVS